MRWLRAKQNFLGVIFCFNQLGQLFEHIRRVRLAVIDDTDNFTVQRVEPRVPTAGLSDSPPRADREIRLSPSINTSLAIVASSHLYKRSADNAATDWHSPRKSSIRHCFLAYPTDDPELDVALSRAYNRIMARACAQSHDRSHWVAIPPLRRIEESLQDIEMGQAKRHRRRIFPRDGGQRDARQSALLPGL